MNSKVGCKWDWNGFCVNEDCIFCADQCPFNSEEAQEKMCRFYRTKEGTALEV